jgi:hypothetical protein
MPVSIAPDRDEPIEGVPGGSLVSMPRLIVRNHGTRTRSSLVAPITTKVGLRQTVRIGQRPYVDRPSLIQASAAWVERASAGGSERVACFLCNTTRAGVGPLPLSSTTVGGPSSYFPLRRETTLSDARIRPGDA